MVFKLKFSSRFKLEGNAYLLFILLPKDGGGMTAMVRILGAAPHRLKTSLHCVCVDKSGYKIQTGVDVRQNKEHWALPYSSYFFNCLLRGTFRPVQVDSNIFFCGAVLA